MKEIEVLLSDFIDVREFVRLCNDITGDITASSGRYIVDAKSIMGIFSLNLSNPVKVTFSDDVSEEIIDKFKVYMKGDCE